MQGPGDRPEATFVAVAGDEVVGYAKFSFSSIAATTRLPRPDRGQARLARPGHRPGAEGGADRLGEGERLRAAADAERRAQRADAPAERPSSATRRRSAASTCAGRSRDRDDRRPSGSSWSGSRRSWSRRCSTAAATSSASPSRTTGRTTTTAASSPSGSGRWATSRPAGRWLVRAVVLPETRELIGHVGFHGPPGVNSLKAADAVEVGYTIFPEHRRQGYATEAVVGAARLGAGAGDRPLRRLGRARERAVADDRAAARLRRGRPALGRRGRRGARVRAQAFRLRKPAPSSPRTSADRVAFEHAAVDLTAAGLLLDDAAQLADAVEAGQQLERHRVEPRAQAEPVLQRAETSASAQPPSRNSTRCSSRSCGASAKVPSSSSRSSASPAR